MIRVYATMALVAAGCLAASLWMARGIRRRGWLIADPGPSLHEGSTMAEVLEAERLASEQPTACHDDRDGEGGQGTLSSLAAHRAVRVPPMAAPGEQVVAHHGLRLTGAESPFDLVDDTAGEPRRFTGVDDDVARAARRAITRTQEGTR